MQIARKRSFFKSNTSIPTSFRYMKFNELVNWTNDTPNTEGTMIIQLSRLELLDDSNNQYQWPQSGVTGYYYNTEGVITSQTVASGESTLRLFDHSVYTKCCTFVLNPHWYLWYDFQNNPINIENIVKWQMWTGNDNASWKNRTPSTCQLLFSNDMNKWYQGGYAENLNQTVTLQNYSLLYEGNFNLISI